MLELRNLNESVRRAVVVRRRCCRRAVVLRRRSPTRHDAQIEKYHINKTSIALCQSLRKALAYPENEAVRSSLARSAAHSALLTAPPPRVRS